MKSTRKVTRVKLHIDQENDFILLGLVSVEPDYKISLTLNNLLGISLRSSQPVKLSREKGTELTFSRFTDSSGSPDQVFTLISNRAGKNFLIKKLKNVDYLFNIHNNDHPESMSSLASKVRSIPGITAVFNIDTDSIKDKNMHLLIQ